MNFLRHIIITLFIVTSLIFPLISDAAETITLPLQKDEINIVDYLEIYEDAEAGLTLKDITSTEYSNKFIPARKSGLNRGFTHSAYWVRFNAQKTIPHSPPAVLIVHFANINRVDFFQLTQEGELIKKVRTGNLRSVGSRDVFNPNIIFTLSLPNESVNTFYLRFKNDATTNLTMSIATADKYTKIVRLNNFLMGIFIGIMLILIGYNFTLGFSFKNKTYFYFNFSIIFFTLYTLAYKGYAYLYLWPDFPFLNLISLELFLTILIYSFLSFADNFLSLKKHFPQIHNIYQMGKTAALLLLISSFFIDFQVVIQLINYVIIISFLLNLYVAYIAWRKKYTSVYFLSSMLFFFTMTLLTMLVVFGVMQSRVFTDNSYIIGSFPPILLMSLALANQVKELKSDKEKIERELSKSIEKFKSFIDYSLDIFWEADKNSVFRYISPNVENVLGWTAEEMIGKRAFDYLKPQEVSRQRELLRTSVLSKEPILGYEYEMRNKNNEWIIFEKNAKPFYDENGKFLGFRGSDRDITVNYQRKKALKESEEKFKAIVQNTQTAILMVDDNYQIIYANPRLEKMIGYSLDKIIGTDFRKYLDPKLVGMVAKRYKLRQQGKKIPESYEIELKNIQEKTIAVKIYVTTVKDFNNKPLTIAQIIDLTKQKHLENQLITSKKMEAIGTLAGGIAHDFNNLLTVIKGYSEVLLMHLKENDQRRKHIETIYSASQKAEALTKQILAFSRKQIYQPQQIDLNKLLSDFIKMAGRLIGEDIQIETNFSKTLPMVKADPGQIEQIIINLLVNARDAINEQKNNREKKITITTGLTDKDNNPLLQSTKTKYRTYIEISVKDTGVGMSEDIKTKIFEPFFTTKDKNKNTGLGLATVFGIISQNDGLIDIESALYKGAVFKIYWPVDNNTEDNLIEE